MAIVRLQLLFELAAEMCPEVGHVLHAQDRVVTGIPVDPGVNPNAPGEEIW